MAPPPPSRIFGQRLGETRRMRGLSQTELADAMTEAGYEMSKTAVLRIENGTRELKLDEALAFAAILHLPLADLLEPPRDESLSITSTLHLEDVWLRRWLATGEPMLVWPETLETRHDRDLASAFLADRALAHLEAKRRGDEELAADIKQRLDEAWNRLGEQTGQEDPDG